MWRLYAGSGNGVAIVTTGASLADAFTCGEDVFIGDVNYFDYTKLSSDFPLHKAFGMHLAKREAFEYEREVRALSFVPIKWSPPPSTERPQFPDWWLDGQPGHSLKVDLPRLVHSVVTAPTSDPWFVDVVRRLCRDMGLDTKVASSELQETPNGYPSNMAVEAAAADHLEPTHSQVQRGRITSVRRCHLMSASRANPRERPSFSLAIRRSSGSGFRLATNCASESDLAPSGGDEYRQSLADVQ